MCSNEFADVKLFVKAGSDGQRYGACPFCQRVFMVLLLKSSKGQFKFKVATVNLIKPPEEFKALGLRRVPALVHGDRTYDNVDDIVQYVDEIFPEVNLFYDNILAENACKNFFSKFCFYIKEVSKDPSHLLMELNKLNDYFMHSNCVYLCGNELSHLDCEVLPKLQHIRIASQSLKNFEIPATLTGLWRYIYQAYSNETFAKTSPSDQEIIIHWADKQETPNLTLEQRTNLSKEPPKYSFYIPAVATPVNLS